MMMLPKEFKTHLIETSISILWDQWKNLGVWIESGEKFKFYSDPEASVFFSKYFAIHEKRLGKIIEEWIAVNRQHLNVTRLKGISKMFFNKCGISVPIEFKTQIPGKSKFVSTLDVLQPENLLPRLRFLFGCSTKAEVIYHLLTKGSSNSNQIAKERFLNQKAVLIELDKLSRAGFLIEKRTGRERSFSISSDFARVLPKPLFFNTVPWVLLTAAFLLIKCLKDDYLEDEYLIYSAFNDFKKEITSMLFKSMLCEIQLNSRTAEEFYSSVVDYWKCLTKKIVSVK